MIPRMTLDQEFNLCPGCFATPFPSVWTIEYLGCVHCEFWLPRAMVAGSELSSTPLPPQPPPPTSTFNTTLDRPRSPSTCHFHISGVPQNRFKKSPQTRGRRLAKTLSPAIQEFRCCPFTSSGNISLPCRHDNCSPPQDVGFLSRRFPENPKWKRARRDAVASFSYEKCGCTSAYLVPHCSLLFTNQR